ncbi:MAG: helix-turn-helix transcriptional regulator [Erysipelotrichaceae bacterium]|nr:helix-turn-helix transcriptional regulator [Erysipelotrichaceae bacterium]MDP3305621.1 helix-turn-helix transcriptional regulator [Erysipelotrichaceae bacterium]
MTNFKKDLNQRLKNSQFRDEYEQLEPDFIIMQALIDARKNLGLTQQELAQRTHINQADISKIEKGISNPSLNTLKKLAKGMNMKLKIAFVPIED